MLPALTLGLSVMAPIARMVRSTMLEILEVRLHQGGVGRGHAARGA